MRLVDIAVIQYDEDSRNRSDLKIIVEEKNREYETNIAAADSSECNPNQDVMRIIDLWDRVVLDFRIARPVEEV